MNRIRLKAEKLRMAAGALLAVVAGFGILPFSAGAQTYPIRFASASTFQAYPTCGYTCANSLGVATGDFNGDGNLDIVDLDTQDNVNLIVGNGDGTFGNVAQPINTVSLSDGYFAAYAIAVGDFNGDGHLDVAVWGVSSQTSGAELQILLGNGAGGFAVPAAYFTAALNSPDDFPTNGLSVADVNHDGKLDIIALASFTQGVFVFLGNGDGTFQAAVNHSVGAAGQAEGFAVADLNADGRPDLVVSINSGVAVLLNQGHGNFAAPVYYASGLPYQAYGGLAVGDVNGDKKPDIVQTDSHGNIIVYLNQGSGVFAESSAITIAGMQFLPNNNLLLEDINADRRLDIVVGDFNGDVHTFHGKGNGTFTTGPGYPLGTFFGYGPLVALGDFNNDGALDLLNTSSYYPEMIAGAGEHPSPTASVSLGRGNGTFQTAEFYDYGATGGRNIVTADFNGDGVPDVAYSFVGNNVGTEDEDIVLLLGTAGGGFAAPRFVTAPAVARAT